MQTKQKPQVTHTYTQRLIEICTDAKRQKNMQTQKCINKHKTYIKQIQYELDLIAYSQFATTKIYKTHSDIKNINE